MQKLCPRCQAPAPADAPRCLRAGCGHQFRTQFPPDRTQLLAPSPFDQTIPAPAPRRRYASAWPTVLSVGCFTLGVLLLSVGWFATRFNEVVAPVPDPQQLTPLVVPPPRPVATHLTFPDDVPVWNAPPPSQVLQAASPRSLTVFWTVHTGGTSFAQVNNTGAEDLKGVSIWRLTVRSDDPMGFSTKTETVRDYATWTNVPTTSRELDIPAGRTVTMIMDIPRSIPADIYAEDRAGHAIQLTQVAPGH